MEKYTSKLMKGVVKTVLDFRKFLVLQRLQIKLQVPKTSTPRSL